MNKEYRRTLSMEELREGLKKSEPQHTPTPWEVVATDTSVKIVASPSRNGRTTEPICDLEADQWTAKDPRTLADAAFIIRAVNEYQKDKEIIADLLKALKAQIQMRDTSKPTKLQVALCWRDNDDLANKWAHEAIAKGEDRS